MPGRPPFPPTSSQQPPLPPTGRQQSSSQPPLPSQQPQQHGQQFAVLRPTGSTSLPANESNSYSPMNRPYAYPLSQPPQKSPSAAVDGLTQRLGQMGSFPPDHPYEGSPSTTPRPLPTVGLSPAPSSAVGPPGLTLKTSQTPPRSPLVGGVSQRPNLRPLPNMGAATGQFSRPYSPSSFSTTLPRPSATPPMRAVRPPTPKAGAMPSPASMRPIPFSASRQGSNQISPGPASLNIPAVHPPSNPGQSGPFASASPLGMGFGRSMSGPGGLVLERPPSHHNPQRVGLGGTPPPGSSRFPPSTEPPDRVFQSPHRGGAPSQGSFSSNAPVPPTAISSPLVAGFTAKASPLQPHPQQPLPPPSSHHQDFNLPPPPQRGQIGPGLPPSGAGPLRPLTPVPSGVRPTGQSQSPTPARHPLQNPPIVQQGRSSAPAPPMTGTHMAGVGFLRNNADPPQQAPPTPQYHHQTQPLQQSGDSTAFPAQLPPPPAANVGPPGQVTMGQQPQLTYNMSATLVGYDQQPFQQQHPQGQVGATGYSQQRAAFPSNRPNKTSRVDPDQIPIPEKVIVYDQDQFLETPYYTLSSLTSHFRPTTEYPPVSPNSGTPTKIQMPPACTTRAHIIDNGNSSPHFMRMTMYSIPCSEELLKQSHLPLGVLVQPLADTGDEIPVVDYGEDGPPRCVRCRCYINPFVKFIDGGRSFVCNQCGAATEVGQSWFSNLDMSGKRLDILDRPEFTRGSIEFKASKEYILLEPEPLVWIFAIDVSWNACRTGLLQMVCHEIRSVVYGTAPIASQINGTREQERVSGGFPVGTRIAIITYDRDIHFYNVHPNLEQFKMMIVPDVDDGFVPIQDGFLVDPRESEGLICKLLETIPVMFAENRTPDTVPGSVVHVLTSFLKPRGGGNIHLFQTSLPSHGLGVLRNRDDQRLCGTDKENTLFVPENVWYKAEAVETVEAHTCVTLFLFPNAYVDVASQGLLPSLTGGETYLYPSFEAQKYHGKFSADFERTISRRTGYQALLRIRTSNGIRVAEHFGNYYTKEGTDLMLAGVNADTTIGALIKHESSAANLLDEKVDSYIQCALLYTTRTGERRIRIHNLAVNNTTNLNSVFRYGEVDTTLAFMGKQAIDKIAKTSLPATREWLTKRCSAILGAYRQNCANSSHSGQLILPESYKLLPILTLGLIKSPDLRDNVPPDVRVARLREGKGSGVAAWGRLVYPRCWRVDNIGYVDHKALTDRYTGHELVRSSMDYFAADGVYLLDTGRELWCWISEQVSPAVVRDVFGVDSVAEVNPAMHRFPVLQSALSQSLNRLVEEIESLCRRRLPVVIVRPGYDAHHIQFRSYLVHDQFGSASGYTDYLCHIHREIQTHLNANNY